MKPDLNIALLNAAQEIINRFSPLIDDEYERSRLGSWGALVLISAMKLDEAGASLDKENQDIIEWLLSNSRIKEDKLEVLKSADLGGRTISFHDENNQKLRRMLSDEVEFLESGGDRVKVLSAYQLLRSMHQRRKVSDLVGLLQQSAD
tara:strand:+ start:1337 stop:1780 length:444 start_codon:yes stop_codon:yes gene_type:complete